MKASIKAKLASMTILFFCGSLESGKDGVGDYTTKLAKELAKSNHSISILAIHDNYITGDSIVPVENIKNVEAFRLSSQLHFTKRRKLITDFIDQHQPDWVSLQYVPFSYNKKGITYYLDKNFKKIKKPVKWHIMFHELWIHINAGSSFKSKLLAFLQKQMIRKLIRVLNPSCITTSIPLYREMLNDEKVRILPLFSNISFYKSNNLTAAENGNDTLRAVHFGSFSSAIDELQKQFNSLKNAGEQLNKKIQFITVGEGGRFKKQSVNLAKTIFGEASICELERLDEQDISKVLQQSNIGISRATVELAGKSGSTLAMLEHGLPVLLRGSKEEYKSTNNSVTYFNKQLLFPDSDYKKVIQNNQPNSRLPQVAQMLIAYFKQCG